MILIFFGNLTVSKLTNGSRTIKNSICISPDVLSFGCHLGGCNLPGDELQIHHSKVKDLNMIIPDSNTQRNEKKISELIDDLYLSFFCLRQDNPEIKRFREKGLNSIKEFHEFYKRKTCQ